MADGGGYPAFLAAQDRAIRGLRGTVLELGAGEGANFGALADGVTWVGLEPHRGMRGRLGERARRHGHTTEPLDAVAEDVPLPDGSVDAVLATTVLCSVDDQDRALAEVARVLAPGGRAVLAEHVAAARGTASRVAQHLARPFSRAFDHGCDPTRDTEAAVRRSGLEVRQVERFDVPVLAGLRVPFVVIQAERG